MSKELRLLYVRKGDKKPEVQVAWKPTEFDEVESRLRMWNLVYCYLNPPEIKK